MTSTDRFLEELRQDSFYVGLMVLGMIGAFVPTLWQRHPVQEFALADIIVQVLGLILQVYGIGTRQTFSRRFGMVMSGIGSALLGLSYFL